MTDGTWINLAAAVALFGLMAYAVLGGADFGGGIWDLAATGPRKADQRHAIARAMGPVWEANHVWLIFVIVTLFTCFPYGYSVLGRAMFLPFHLALVGIMLRGAAFVFRGHEAGKDDGATGRWGTVFGVASVISPFLLGAVFGAITAGEVRVVGERVSVGRPLPWLSGYAIGCGLLALSTCAYLAAVYLAAETEGPLREDFRQRAILAGTTTAGLAGAVLVLAYNEAPWFLAQLTAPRSWPVLLVGLLLFGLSAVGVFRRWYRTARVFAAGEVVVLLLGWGLAHRPYLIYPDVTLERAAGPIPTIRVLMYCLPVGMALLAPSLWLLFRVFKAGREPANA